MAEERRPSWREILWSRLYDFVEQRWGQKGLIIIASIIGIIIVGGALYKIGLFSFSDKSEESTIQSLKSNLYIQLNPKEHHLLALLAKFQKDNGLESIALDAHGFANQTLPRADPKQPNFDFRTELFGPPGPVSDDRPEFQIVLQNIPERYVRHYKTPGSSFWISVTEEGYKYLAEHKN